MSDAIVESSSSDNDSYRMLSDSDSSSGQDDSDASHSTWLDQEALQPFNYIETAETGLSVLCGACHSFFRGKKEVETKYKHIQLLTTLRDTARRGCRLCTMILGKVDRETANHFAADTLNIYLEIDTFPPNDDTRFDIFYYYRKGSKRRRYGNFVQGTKIIRFFPRRG